MTKMTTILDNYDNIRTGIIELLKAARSLTQEQCLATRTLIDSRYFQCPTVETTRSYQPDPVFGWATIRE